MGDQRLAKKLNYRRKANSILQSSHTEGTFMATSPFRLTSIWHQSGGIPGQPEPDVPDQPSRPHQPEPLPPGEPTIPDQPPPAPMAWR